MSLVERRDIVLVVDDAPGTLGLLNDTLEGAGYMVLVAQSAAAAMAVIERITPDIVLMDAVMPGMDGFEACRRMKRNATLLSVPVIFMTGLTESEDVVRGFDAGGVDYVIKPVVPDEVVARISAHLANARLTRSAHAALDVAGRFLLAVDREGILLWATPQAAGLLRAAGATGRRTRRPGCACPAGRRSRRARCRACPPCGCRTGGRWSSTMSARSRPKRCCCASPPPTRAPRRRGCASGWA
ncbi:response regulator [Teichococcus aestuarii]|uniref:response regulator n=1 Tax=Teichococcus aestuarii TaxID=568898 RepID=UPI003609529D